MMVMIFCLNFLNYFKDHRIILTASTDTSSKIFFPKNHLNSYQTNVLTEKRDVFANLKLYAIDVDELLLFSQYSK